MNTDKTLLDFLPQIEEALARGHGTHNVEDMILLIESGKRELWVEGDGLIITKVEDWPRMRVMRFWLAAGKMEDVMALEPRIIQRAREMGCTGMVIDGRKGWAKVLSKGWEEDGTRSFTKAL